MLMWYGWPTNIIYYLEFLNGIGEMLIIKLGGSGGQNKKTKKTRRWEFNFSGT